MDATLKAVSGATAGLQRRTNLIWWKKEHSIRRALEFSYRSMTPSAAAALMAFDLHQQVPTFSPASVTAFLQEAVFASALNRSRTGQPRSMTSSTKR